MANRDRDYREEENDDYKYNDRKKYNAVNTFIVMVVLIMFIGGALYYDTYIGGGIVKSMIASTQDSSETEGKEQEVNGVDGNILTPILDEEELFSGTNIKSEDNEGEGFFSSLFQRTEKIPETMALDTDSKTVFVIYGKNFLQCTSDGVKFFTGIGKQKWNSTSDMFSPIAIKEGNYTAVYELLGRSVKLYNDTGEIYSIQTEDPIIRTALSESGYIGIIINSENGYKIEVYNSKGEKALERYDGLKGVFPMGLDISDDSRILAISYIDTTDIEIVSKVLFFYIGKREGKEYTDNMFAAIQKNDEIIPTINFMNNDSFVAVSDKSIYSFKMDGSEAWIFELTNKMDKINLESKDYIVVAYGNTLSKKDGKEKGTVEWINLSGKSTGVLEIGTTVTYLSASSKGSVIGSYKDFYGTNDSGKVMWEHKAIQDVDSIKMMTSTNEVLYVTKTSVEIVNMKKVPFATGDTKENPDEDIGGKDIEKENITEDNNTGYD